MLIAFAALAGGQAQAAARCDPFTAFPLVLNFGAGVNTGSGEDLNCFAKKTQAAINAIPTLKGAPNGFASLDNTGLIPNAQIPFMNALGNTVYRLPPSHFADSVNLRDFGARGDAPDNTFALQQAIDAVSPLGSTLRVTASVDGGGVYKIGPGVNWRDVNLEFDEGAGFVNLDGSTYSGNFYSGAANIPGVFDPFRLKLGRRSHSPSTDFLVLSKPGTNKVNDVIYNGTAPYPYSVTENEQSYFLGGQSSASSGSWAGKTIYGNVYNYSNGPGVQMTCSFTQNSQYGGSCSPSPTATNPATGLPYLFGSSVAISGAGVPANAFVDSWADGVIALGAGAPATAVGWTAATGTYTVTVTPGRSEFNPLSLAVTPVGTSAAGGPKGGMNWYNESTMRSAIGTTAADQEGALFSWLVSGTKSSPGNLRDKLHNGSAVIAAVTRPDDTANASKTYPMDDGVAVTGWSGPAGLAGGSAAGATYGAFNGLRIGGICTSIYCNAPSRSFFKVGLNIQDYETAISITNPAASYSGTAIYTAPGAGNVDIRDNLYVGRSIFEPNAGTPTSSTAPCAVGQHAWDASYEYRCVAANTWKRAALATW
jgi:hypothetical protein